MPAPARLDVVDAAVAALRRVSDPRARIVAIRTVSAELDRQTDGLAELLRESILELRADTPPATWAEIGDLLGVTPQRAFQLAEQPTRKETPRD